MATLVDQIYSIIDGHIDFEGQKRVEVIHQIALIVSGIVSFVVGFLMQSLVVTLGIFALGFIITAFTIAPPWPVFNRHPIEWLPSSTPANEQTNKTPSISKSSKKSSSKHQ